MKSRGPKGPKTSMIFPSSSALPSSSLTSSPDGEKYLGQLQQYCDFHSSVSACLWCTWAWMIFIMIFPLKTEDDDDDDDENENPPPDKRSKPPMAPLLLQAWLSTFSSSSLIARAHLIIITIIIITIIIIINTTITIEWIRIGRESNKKPSF